MRCVPLDCQSELLTHLALGEHSRCVLSQTIYLDDSIADKHLAFLLNLLGIVATHEAMFVNAFNTEALSFKLIHLNAKRNKARLFVEHNGKHLVTIRGAYRQW